MFRRFALSLIVLVVCVVSAVGLLTTAPRADAAALSGGTVAQLAYNAGFRGNDLNVAVAVSRAESGWNTAAIGDYGASIGLWQINLPSHPQYSRASLLNGQFNANAAFTEYRANGFGPWTVYRTGAYRQFLTGYAIAAPAVVQHASAPPVAAVQHAPSVTTQASYHIVWGDTLSGIALRYHTTVAHLAAVNGIANPNLIYAGAWLRLS